MSRLIDGGVSAKGNRSKSQDEKQAPLPPQRALVHLKRCQAIAVELARQSFDPFMSALTQAFDSDIDTAKSNQEVSELSGIQRLFQKNSDELQKYFAGYVAEGFVKFKQQKLQTQFNADGGSELSIVDNLALEESLLLSKVVQSINEDLKDDIWVLNRRLSLINGGIAIQTESNPSAPIQLAESMRKVTKLVPMNIAAANTVFGIFGQHLNDLAAEVVRETNRYLAEQGLLPNLQYSKAKARPKAKAPEPQAIEKEVGAMLGSDEKSSEYQSSLLGAIRGLQQTLTGFSRSPSPAVSGSAMGVQLSDHQVIEALQSLQVVTIPEAGQAPSHATERLAPMNIAAAQQQIQVQLAEKGDVGESGMQAIDLVGRVFDYVLRDKNLPDSVKAALSYLHTPFLKLAFMDADFFEKSDHPARVLLNNLAEAGIRWVGNDGTIQHNMLTKIRETVDRLLGEFTNDVQVITLVLIEFNTHTKNIVRRQELMEKRAAEKAQGEEKLREVKQRVNSEIISRKVDKDLPSVISLFLLQPWFDYLSFCLLRYGDSSQQWSDAIRLVDNLIWAIDHKKRKEDVIAQHELIERLPSSMNAGFEVIGYDASKAVKLNASIIEILWAALKHEALEPEPAPVREEAKKVIAAKKQALSTAQPQGLVTDEEQRVIEGLKKIEFGTWFEFEGGKRLKVAWYNARTMHYMLVNQVGKKEAMLTGLELARKMIAKQLHIISGSSKPFFERALEDIYRTLSASESASKSRHSAQKSPLSGETQAHESQADVEHI